MKKSEKILFDTIDKKTKHQVYRSMLGKIDHKSKENNNGNK